MANDNRFSKRTAIIGLLLLVILLLWFWRRNTIINQPGDLDVNLNLGTGNINLPGFNTPDFPEFRNPYNIKRNDFFDWMNTTNIACNCNAKSVVQINPIITSTETVIKFVQNPNPPLFPVFYQAPIFNPPSPPPVVIYRIVSRYYNGTTSYGGWIRGDQDSYNRAVENAAAHNRAYDNTIAQSGGRISLVTAQFLHRRIVERQR